MKERLTEHFTIDEFLYSRTANECGIDNVVDTSQHMDNGVRLAKELERVRKLFGDTPVIVSSGYRCAALNKEVGGVENSAHTKFLAADINIKGMDTKEVYETIKEYIDGFDCDQLIYEHNVKKDVEWVHFAISEEQDNPKRECFEMIV